MTAPERAPISSATVGGVGRSSATALDRRSFLVRGACGLVALTTGCAALVSVPVRPVNGVIRLSTLEHPSLAGPGGWLKVRPVAWESPLYVLALGGGSYAAVSPICTHQGCTVDIAGARLICPCHGSTYNRDGTVVRGPAEQPLQGFPVRVLASGELLIDIGGAI